MSASLAPASSTTNAAAALRRRSRIGILAVLALVLAAAASVLTIPAAAPASATGTCSAGTPKAFWYTPFSVQLKRKTNCTYYARLVIDDELYGVGIKISIKVERQQKSPYGWYTTETKSKSTYWGGGTYDTATVQGLPSSSGEDRHRACWRYGSGSWTCTGWAAV